MSNICPICKSEGTEYSKNSFLETKVYFCKSCDFYYNDINKIKDISKYYSKDYWDRVRKKRVQKTKLYQFSFNIYNKFLDVFKSPQLNFNSDFNILKKYIKIKRNLNFLEIGASNGRNLIHLHNKSINVTGVEPDKLDSENINKKLNKNICFNQSYEDCIFNKKFDIIYLRHVFEHFMYLDNVINKFKNDLKNKDSLLYINVPNIKNNNYLKNSIYNHPHTYHFTKNSLKKLFENHGFKIIHLETYDFKYRGFGLILSQIFGFNNLYKSDEKKAEYLIIILKLA